MGIVSFIDVVFAEKLLYRNFDEAKNCEEAAAFLCYLCRAAREGHVCVKVEGDQIFPSPAALWETENPELLAFTKNLARGAKHLPACLITDVAKNPQPTTPICRRGPFYYFQKHWLYASQVDAHFERIRSAPPALPIRLAKSEGLNREQEEAISRFSEHSLTLICGGPGTGKTYTAGKLIKIFWEFLKEEPTIALAAPTGKAAANLQKSLQHAAASPSLRARTLHALLHRQQRLKADLILVDEASMIDIRLMARLLAAIKTGARLVLMGDPFQLPPVEVGSPFADVLRAPSYAKHVVTLKTCLRTDRQEVIAFAQAVREGNSEKAFHVLASPSSGIAHVKETKNVFEHALSFFPAPKLLGDKEMLKQYEQFRLLSPLRQGPFGVHAINLQVLQHMRKQVPRDEWFVAPIIITSNDYRLDLYNGEVGILVSCHSSEDYALFPNHEGKKIPACLLSHYEYAYCLSVHKSQGSEFDHVLLLMPEGAEVFGREILYTAATRARKKLEIWGSLSTLRKTIGQDSSKKILHQSF